MAPSSPIDYRFLVNQGEIESDYTASLRINWATIIGALGQLLSPS
jgi:hypothetical protein